MFLSLGRKNLVMIKLSMEKQFFGITEPILIVIAIVISVIQLTIKGIALWRASKGAQRNWFVALFILIPFNDLGILELIFLFRFAKKRLTLKEILSWFHR